MVEDWTAIAAEVSAAIEDIGFQVFIAREISPEPQTPWDTSPRRAASFAVTAIDMGVRQSRMGGEITQSRVLLVASGDIAPEIGDMVTVRGRQHAVLSVMPTAPGGVDVMHKVELRL